VERIIAQIAERFIKKLTKTLTASNNFSEIEENVTREIEKCAAEVTGAYLEHLDQAIAADKTGRREAGYSVERYGDERKLLTKFGEVAYKRTYYKKASGGYDYLVDNAIGIDGRVRISEGLGLSLVNAAKDMSYAKASRYVTQEAVSRQTVMRRLRQSKAEATEISELRCVPKLHIDADEAHITLCGGKRSEVPLISVYEGIERYGKRGICTNVFHISEYGKTPDDIWEQALNEIERRYDLTGTKIYLHGDGGAWIQTGLEWIPDAVFVLDKYHKNKAIKTMTAGLEVGARYAFECEIRDALNDEDMEFFEQLTGSLCLQLPERADTILESAGYLKRFVKGISICMKDPGANNGGCTEPHVSHVLSARLSSRPMAWSKQTLESLASVLAAGRVDFIGKDKPESLPKPLRKAAVSANKAFCKGFGIPSPDSIGNLPISGKITGTQRLLKLYA
jgi:hypothetical protein